MLSYKIPNSLLLRGQNKSCVFQQQEAGVTPEARRDRALKKENVRKYLEGAAGDQAVFVVQLSILNRMSLLAGFAELGRPGGLTVPALSPQLPKRGIRHES